MTSPLRRTHYAGVRALAVFAVVALALTACSSDTDDGAATGEEQEELRPLTVVLDWTPNTNHGGMYLADAEGWYREAGLDVEFVEPGDSSSLQLLAAGRADVAVSVAEEVLPARAEGLPVQSIAAVIQHNTSSLVSLAGEGITSPRHLEGKTYGGWGGQLEESLINRLVECDGGDPSAVEFVDVGEADYRIGLERNQYDFVWIYEAWDGVRLTEIDGVELNRIAFADHTDCIPDWYTPVLATSDDVVADRREDVEAFLEVTRRGYVRAMEDPAAAAAALLEVSPDLDPELVELSASWLATRFAEDPAEWGRQEARVWDSFAAFLVEAGMLDEGFDASTAWTDELFDAG